MGAGGSSNQSSQSAPSRPIYTNPLGIAFGNLFGQNYDFNKKRGGFRLGTPGGDDEAGFANQIFGPDMFDSLGDQLDPVDNSLFADMATQNLGITNDLFQNTLLPGAEELASTGFRTDLAPITAQSLRLFNEEIIPGLANQFGMLGGGGQNQLSSDFGAAAAREGAGIATDLGALNVQLSESAADRRTQGLGLAGELGQMSAAFPSALGSDILALNEQNFDFSLLQREGGQLMNLFNNLMGVTQPDPILGQVSSGTGSSSNIGVL